MNVDPAKLSLSNFLARRKRRPAATPPSFTNWMQLGAWAVELYEPELLSTADARTTINYAGKPRSSDQPLFVQLSWAWRITPTCLLPRMRRCAPTVWAHAVRPCFQA